MNPKRYPFLLAGMLLAGALLGLAACQMGAPNPTSKFMIPFVGGGSTAQSTLPNGADPKPGQATTPLPPTLTFTPFQPGATLTLDQTLTPGPTTRATKPITRINSISRNTICRIPAGFAPIAMRIPISRVRRMTLKAITP